MKIWTGQNQLQWPCWCTGQEDTGENFAGPYNLDWQECGIFVRAKNGKKAISRVITAMVHESLRVR